MTWIQAVPAVIVGLLSLWRIAFVIRAKRVIGTIVEIKLGGEDNDLPGPVVEYAHPAGGTRRLESRWFGSPYMKSKVGDPLGVLVVGERARFGTFGDLFLFPVILGVVATILIATLYLVS